MRELFDKNKILETINKHSEELTSTSSWDRYRVGKDLPHSQTLISHFGSWNNLKKELNLTLNKQSRPVIFSDEELYKIIKEHKDHYTSVADWNVYAEQNGLPSHALITDRLEPESIYYKTGIIVRFTHTIIKDLMLKFYPSTPPTMKEWDMLSEREYLPSSSTVARRFGSWRALINILYQK